MYGQKYDLSDDIDPVVERVARALCEVDGTQAECVVQTGEMITVRRANIVSYEPKTTVAWRGYVGEAKRFVAVEKVLRS